MNAKPLEQFVKEAQGGRLSRRALMARAVALGLGGLSLQDAPPAAAAVSKKIAFKFAYTSTPTNPVSMGYERFAAVVREKGRGEIAVSTYCCNQLGNDQELVQSVQYGALQMGASSNNNFDQFTSKMMALELPYLVRSADAYHKFWRTSYSDDIRKDIESKLGIKILMVMNAGGFRSIETISALVHRPADLKGIKLRAANTPIELATLKAWGANPVPLPYNQVFTALQQGTVDGEVLQPVWFLTDKHWEVAKKICDIHYIMLSHIGFINLRYFNSLPKDVQDILLESARVAEDFEWKVAARAVEHARAKLKAIHGVEWYEPTGPILTQWIDQSRPVWNQFSERIGSGLIKRIEALNA